jgi:site-specific recombinase XerD
VKLKPKTRPKNSGSNQITYGGLMVTTDVRQLSIKNTKQEEYLALWVEAFMKDRQAQGMSKHTIRHYYYQFKPFLKYCDNQLIKSILDISPQTIREYLLFLQGNGHNAGGLQVAYRVIRAFLNWYEIEVEPENWKNPIRKVKAPKVPIEPLEPANPESISKIISVCPNDNIYGIRDKAILYTLLDTGCRASEFLQIDLKDIDLISGSIILRKTKGKRPRTVFISKLTKKIIKKYIALRDDNSPALWVNDEKERLEYWGLRSMLTRRAIQAGVKPEGVHSIRRLYALTMLRNGVNVYSLQLLMGHSDLQVLRRYLKETDSDLRAAHEMGNPIEILRK